MQSMQRDMSFTCHANAQTHAKSGFEQLKELRASTFTCTYAAHTIPSLGFL